MRQLIETIIRDRIGELERLERGETSRRMQLSYQDKRDELEALLLRFHALRGAGSTGLGNPS
jgi:hypothetical protein